MPDVNVAKDWIDYASAIGSLVSGIVAVAAVVLAWWSAKASKSSARIAEDLLGIATDEREARLTEEAKKAQLDFNLQAHLKPAEPDGKSICGLELFSRNTGQRPAAPAVFSVSIGRGGRVFKCDPDWEPTRRQNPTHEDDYVIQWGKGKVPALTTWEELTIQVQTVRVAYYSVVFPASPGIYECWAKLQHEGFRWTIILTGARDQIGDPLAFKISPVSVSSVWDTGG